MSTVSIVRCESYADAVDGVREAIDFLGDVEIGGKVLIKPNVLQASHPDKAITTHPEVVRGVIRWVKDRASKIFVGDSPGILGYGKSREALEVSQIGMVCREEGAELSIFEERYEKVKIPPIEVLVAARALEVDHIINVPKLKTHTLMIFTGAIKNMFGLVVGAEKGRVHRTFPNADDLGRWFASLASRFMPTLSVMDGIVGRELESGRGKLHKVGVIIASRDPVALDAVACRIIGIDPNSVPAISQAAELGIGCGDLERIEIVGEDLESVSHKFKPPRSYVPFATGIFWRFLSKFFTRPKPFVNARLCRSCGQCEKVCPVNAIRIVGHPRFNYNLCIRCYCCKETCPEGAIDVKTIPSALTSLFR